MSNMVVLALLAVACCGMVQVDAQWGYGGYGYGGYGGWPYYGGYSSYYGYPYGYGYGGYGGYGYGKREAGFPEPKPIVQPPTGPPNAGMPPPPQFAHPSEQIEKPQINTKKPSEQ